MARTSKKQKIHSNWLTIGSKDGRFVYRCSKCKWETLNGEPLSKPYDSECPGEVRPMPKR
jgi:hypothetical protein